MKPAPTSSVTIHDVLGDPAAFEPLFRGLSWRAWRAFLSVLFGLAVSGQDAALVRQCTGRSGRSASPARAAFCIVGRRGGKSRVGALVAVFLACFRDYRTVLAPGERGVVMLIATDRQQARVLKRYISALLAAVPMLARMVTNETAEAVELENRIVIEIHTASFRSVRGYTVVAAILDEIAFWPTDDAANPDTEILNAVRPAMATVPGALLLGLSTPYARRGELWTAHREHYGKEGDPILIWQADTKTMNPSVPDDVIAAAYATDEAAASAEYGAQFRRDIDAFIPREAVEACVVAGRYELPPVLDVTYAGFVDPSGGSQDSMTLAIAHQEPGVAVLDLVREVRPPFSPESVAKEFAETLKRYRVDRVVGDRYGGEWPREQFRKHGIEYLACDQVKSDLYREVLPLLTSQTVALLDSPRLVTQLCNLERRTGRGGHDTIDHSPTRYDDLANCVAGVVSLVNSAEPSLLIYYRDLTASTAGQTALPVRPMSNPLIDIYWQGRRQCAARAHVCAKCGVPLGPAYTEAGAEKFHTECYLKQ